MTTQSPMPKLTTHLHLPSPVDTVTNLLTPNECQDLISAYTNLVPSNVTPDTVRDRETFVDPELAERIWERLKGFYGESRIVDEEGVGWKAEGLNEKFRLCRYVKGGKFSPHFDGTYMASVSLQSFASVNIYLSNVPDSHKGATRILKPGLAYVKADEVLFKVQPVEGTAAIFRHDVWHDGEELTDGIKYLLRTDIMYKMETDFDFETMCQEMGEEQKGKRALKIAENLEDSGHSGEAVRWYKRAFRLWPELEGR